MGEIINLAPEQLMICSQERLRGFFGQDIVVPFPPEELFPDLKKVIEFGAKDAKPEYLPRFTFTEKTKLDGW